MARKRAPGEGSIHRRHDGRWEASRTVGRTAGGNPRRIRAYGRTKAEALNKLERLIVELGGVAGAGPVPDSGGLTVRGLFERYLAAKAGVAKLRETTLASYRWYVARYILPALGNLPLRRLRPSHVQDLLAELGRREVEDRRQGQDRQRDVATRAGRWCGTDAEPWVFTTSTGQPVAARNLLHQLERICRRAGVRRLAFHCLRHTFATMALRSGVPIRDLADRLGHSDPGLTLRVYTHVLEDTARAAALPLDELLHGRKPAAGAEEPVN